MQFSRNKVSYSGIAVKSEACGGYETGNSGAFKKGMVALMLDLM